jgi:Zn-dependent M28 family amino/carboxypeptidase
VLFAAWGGEEAGQAGLEYYLANPVFPLEQTVSTVQVDTPGGGGSYRLEGQGFWETDGILMLPMDLSSDLLDVRIKITTPEVVIGDPLPFREAGVPELFLTWQDASEDNWPDHLADEYNPDFMYVAGRVLALVMMTAVG